MTRDFKVGDVVFLKSDGPAMTVTEIGSGNSLISDLSEGKVQISWFDGSQMEHDILPVVCLIPESELFCNNDDCIHCFPTSNCLRDDCPHCKESRADDESDIFPSPENN